MNLANEFKQILEDFGTDILLLRKENKLHCSCFNEVTQEASRDCPICLGLGWMYSAERHTVRIETASSSPALTKLLVNQGIGDVIVADRKFYCLPTIKATEKDLIIEVEWDRFNKPIYNNQGLWSITNDDNNRTLGQGKDVFKVYYASDTPVRSKIRGIRVSEVNGIKKYNVLMEG